MADNKLNYQQARKVRKSKFSDLLLDQLAQQKSVTSAIGKTISMKTEARVKGIKEKFDPLNIVKFMTFGSRFGPAMYGKMMGRQQRDIDYFTGRTKSIVGGRNTADKLKKVPGEDSSGLNSQLSKIYSFLVSAREEDNKLKQLANNREEELALEKQRRHAQLLVTLRDLVESINSSGKQTAQKEEDSSLLSNLMRKIKDMGILLAAMGKSIMEIAKKIGMSVAKPLIDAASKVPGLLSAAAATGGLTIFGVGATGAALTVGATNVLSNMTPEMREQLQGDIGSDTALAAAALNAAKTPEEKATYEKSLTKYRKYMEDAPLRTRAAALYSPAAAGEYLRKQTKIPKSDLDEFEKFGIIPPAPKAEPVKKKSSMVPETPDVGEFDTLGNPISSAPMSVPNMAMPAAKAQPVSSIPSSAPVAMLTNSNNDMNMSSVTKNDDMKTVVSKTVNNLSQKQERTGLRPSQISVRNDEETFMRLIIESTRVV